MSDCQKYINALRKCAKEHENDRTFTGHIIVSDLCQDTANLLETLKQEPITDRIEYGTDGNPYKLTVSNGKEFKQEPILDKIRAEIEQTVSRYSISRERSYVGQVEWSDRLIKESEVLQIIDKYRGNSDCHSCKTEYDCYDCKKYTESEEEE